MNTILKLDKNNWLLSMSGKYNGRSIKKRYRNKDNIKEFLNLLETPDTMYVYNNNIKMIYPDDTFVLKNYKDNEEVYKMLIERFGTKAQRINASVINSNKLLKLTDKVLVGRKVFLAAIGLTFAISSSICTTDSDIKQDEIIEIIDEKPIEEETLEEIVDEKPIEEEVLETGTTVDEVLDEDKTISFDIVQNMSLDNKIFETENIRYMDNYSKFKVCSKLDNYAINKMTSFIEKNGDIFWEVSKTYGVDPYLLVAKCMTECSLKHNETIPGGKKFNGCAYGAMQIEKSNIGSVIKAYNYEIDDYEAITITEERLMDFETNVKIGAMIMQKNLEKYNNNVYIAIQSYNYGRSAMNMIIQKYADEIGKTYEEVLSNMNDFGWLKYVDDLHNNPKKYFPKWKYSTYGNNNYINKVLGYFMGQNMVNADKENYYIYDLVSNNCIIQRKSDSFVSEQQTVEYMSKTR